MKRSFAFLPRLLLMVVVILTATCIKVLAAIPFMDDNLSDCHPRVQSSVNNLRRAKGEFSIHCEKGVIERMAASRNSPLFTESPSEFVNAHWELFLASAPKSQLEFRPESAQAGEMYRQQYQGFTLPNSFVYKFYPWWPAQKTLEYQFSIIDTSSWNFQPKQKLSCDKAVELAKKYDGDKGISKDLDYVCATKEAVISLNSFPEGPVLIWAVKTQRKSQLLRPSSPHQGYDGRVFHVDADSGRIHAFTVKPSDMKNGWPKAGGFPK